MAMTQQSADLNCWHTVGTRLGAVFGSFVKKMEAEQVQSEAIAAKLLPEGSDTSTTDGAALMSELSDVASEADTTDSMSAWRQVGQRLATALAEAGNSDEEDDIFLIAECQRRTNPATQQTTDLERWYKVGNRLCALFRSVEQEVDEEQVGSLEPLERRSAQASVSRWRNVGHVLAEALAKAEESDDDDDHICCKFSCSESSDGSDADSEASPASCHSQKRRLRRRLVRRASIRRASQEPGIQAWQTVGERLSKVFAAPDSSEESE